MLQGTEKKLYDLSNDSQVRPISWSKGGGVHTKILMVNVHIPQRSHRELDDECTHSTQSLNFSQLCLNSGNL